MRRLNPLLVDDDEEVGLTFPLANRFILPALRAPSLPDNLLPSHLDAMRIIKGTVLKKAAIEGISMAAAVGARSLGDSIITELQQQPLRRGETVGGEFNVEYRYGHGCAERSFGISCRMRVWRR